MEPDATAVCTLKAKGAGRRLAASALVSCHRSSYRGRDGNKTHVLTYRVGVTFNQESELSVVSLMKFDNQVR
jgi:hypothetical protein